MKLVIKESQWSGWGRNNNKQEKETVLDVELNKQYIINKEEPTKVNWFTKFFKKDIIIFGFKVKAVEENSIIIETGLHNHSYAPISVDKNKQDFILTIGRSLRLETIYKDNGYVYCLDLINEKVKVEENIVEEKKNDAQIKKEVKNKDNSNEIKIDNIEKPKKKQKEIIDSKTIEEAVNKAMENLDSSMKKYVLFVVKRIADMEDGEEGKIVNILGEQVEDINKNKIWDIYTGVEESCKLLNIRLGSNQERKAIIGLPYNVIFAKNGNTYFCTKCGRALETTLDNKLYCKDCDKYYEKDGYNVGKEIK